jgi:hypothetical protein
MTRICTLVNEYNNTNKEAPYDLVSCGGVGRKGVSLEKHKGASLEKHTSHTALGSTTDLALGSTPLNDLRSVNASTMISKQSINRGAAGHTIGVAFDGSNGAERALNLAARLLKKEDTVLVLWASTNDADAEDRIKSQAERWIKSPIVPCEGSFLALKPVEGATIAKTLADAVLEHALHYMVSACVGALVLTRHVCPLVCSLVCPLLSALSCLPSLVCPLAEGAGDGRAECEYSIVIASTAL